MDMVYQDIHYSDENGKDAFVIRMVTIDKIIFHREKIEIHYFRDGKLCKIVFSKFCRYKLVID